jgi:hypothetical protein
MPPWLPGSTRPTAEEIAAARKQLTELCEEATKTDQEETRVLQNYRSDALDAALASESELLRFLADPETQYLDRMAAASRGADLITPEQLPNLWHASANLRHAVGPSPCEYLYSSHRAVWQWIARSKDAVPPNPFRIATVILGRDVQPPSEYIDYPATFEARRKAPWEWQLRRALPILMDAVSARYATPELYPQLVATAWGWKPANEMESWVRADAMRRGPRVPLLLETLVKLSLEQPARRLPCYLQVNGYDTYHFEELTLSAQIALLIKTTDEKVASQIAFEVQQIAKATPSSHAPYNGLSLELKPLKSSTAILELSRWALDPSVDEFNRYYSFASAVCKLLENSPSERNPRLDPEDPAVSEAMRAFEAWFTAERPALEIKANAERPWLQSLWRELHLDLE